MAFVTNWAMYLYDRYLYSLTRADERVADWPLMQSPVPTWVLTALYLVVVKVGPRLMENRKPFDNKPILFAYNVALIALNFHICKELLVASTLAGYNYSCQPVSYTYDENEMRIAKALWWYYFSKLIEFLDTVFFILRKKNNQVSYLHVYHHATMFPIWWIGMKWVPGGQSFFGAMMNSFIHVVMYSYYGISALGPRFQKFLWWKKHLTTLQLIQFFIGSGHAISSLVTRCDFPLWMQYTSLVYGFSMITLFLNFYIKAYSGQSVQKSKALSSSSQDTNGYATRSKTRPKKD